MAQKIFTVFLTIFLLQSCDVFQKQLDYKSNNSVEVAQNHDYNEVKNKTINFDEIFKQKNEQYFVYFYSLTCSHCGLIKNQMIEYGLSHENIYFVQASEDVKISENTDSVVGATSIEEISILGYPSLLEINQKVCVFITSGSDNIISKLNL